MRALIWISALSLLSGRLGASLLRPEKSPEESSYPKIMNLPQWKGFQAQREKPLNQVVRDEESWKSLWGEASSEKLPEVDFTQFMVVGVFLGLKPTGGYEAEILEPKVEGKRLVVEYREENPPPGSFVIQAFTSPYHLMILPKTDLPVAFRKI